MIVAPGSTIGIMGGGQLGRMIAIAAAQLGYRTHVYAPEAHSVAAEVAGRHTAAAYDDEQALAAFAAHVDVVTFEFENVPVDAMRSLAGHVTVHPGVRSLGIAQDRIEEKRFAAGLGVPVAPFAEIRSQADLAAAVATIGAPAILKTAREGYDGKGQARVDAPDGAAAAWDAVGHQRAIYEQRVAFIGEFSVLIARAADGSTALWECPHNVHADGILVRSSLPAHRSVAVHCADAVDHTLRMAEALDHVGVLACEFFATDDGALFNEMAPRVHNSGHWTIEGARTSQFENHVRAVCGLPLGATDRLGDGVVMRNLIGDDAAGWAALLADPACHLHLYGKGAPQPGRKMGHATWVRHDGTGA